MPLFIHFSEQDFKTQLSEARQAGYELGFTEGVKKGLMEGAQEANALAIDKVRRFYQEINQHVCYGKHPFLEIGKVRIEDLLIQCSIIMQIEHDGRVQLKQQVEEEDHKIRLEIYNQNQEEIKRLKEQLGKLEKDLSGSRAMVQSLEQKNQDLYRTMATLQDTLDRANKQGK